MNLEPRPINPELDAHGTCRLLLNELRTTTMQKRVVSVAIAHVNITIDEISHQTGISIPDVRKALHNAIATGDLKGRIEGSTFIRAE